MNRNAILSAAVIGTVVLAASRAQQREISGHARVHDGDTIIIDGVHVRLRGIDAEELSMTNGPKSRAVMQDTVGDAIVTCRPDGSRSYNRVVATCFLPDGTDISRELIHRGWALRSLLARKISRRRTSRSSPETRSGSVLRREAAMMTRVASTVPFGTVEPRASTETFGSFGPRPARLSTDTNVSVGFRALLTIAVLGSLLSISSGGAGAR